MKKIQKLLSDLETSVEGQEAPKTVAILKAIVEKMEEKPAPKKKTASKTPAKGKK